MPLSRAMVPLLPLLVLLAALAAPAAAARPAQVIVLPGASSAEGIAAGRGATFYAGDLFAGENDGPMPDTRRSAGSVRP